MSRRKQACIAAVVVLEEQQARDRRRERTVWAKPWLLRRVTLGYFDTLMQELMRESVPSSPLPYLRTASARKPHGLRTIPQKACGDCAVTALKLHECRTISAQLPYGFVPISPPIVRTKHRTIIVNYVNTYAVVRSHIRCPKNRTENRRRSYRTAPVANVN